MNKKLFVKQVNKTTIARTIAREYYDTGCFMASFFFSRGDEDVTHAGKFVATIASQLAERSEEFKTLLQEAVSRGQNIETKTLRDQWKALVVEPLLKLSPDSVVSPFLIVIDALDECEKEVDIKMMSNMHFCKTNTRHFVIL